MSVVTIRPYDPDAVSPPAEVLSIMESGLVNITRRVEFYEADAVTRWYPDPLNPNVQRLIDGSVNVDSSSDERRKLDVTLDNIDKLLRPNSSNGFWYDKVIKVFRGVTYDPRDISPKAVIIESDNDNDTSTANIAGNAIKAAGFSDIDLQLGVTDSSLLKDYSWVVSAMQTTPTAIASLLTSLWSARKNIITFGTGSGAGLLPHYSTYAAPSVAHAWTGTPYASTSTEGGGARTNYITSPRPDPANPSTTAWSQYSAINGNFTVLSANPGSFRATKVTDSQNCGASHAFGPITPRQVTISVEIRSPSSNNSIDLWQLIARDDPNNDSTLTTGSVVAGAVTGVLPADDTYHRYFVTFTIPAGRNLTRVYVVGAANAGTVIAGDYIDFRNVMVSDGALGTYFDGYTQGAPITWGIGGVTGDSPTSSVFAGAVTESAGTATGTAPSALVAGAQRLAVWTNTPSPQFITAAVIRNNNGAVWLDVRLPSLSGPVTRSFIKTFIQFVRNVTSTEVWETQLGEFYIDNISEANFPNQLKVVARDATKKLMNDKLSRTASFVVGTSLRDFVTGQAALAGIPVSKMRFNMANEALTTELSFDKGTSRWDMIKGALQSFNYESFMDGQGNFVIRPFNDPTLSPIDFTFLTGPQGNLVTFEKAVNDSRIYNIVQVTAVPSDNAEVPVAYFGEARNDDPNSPTNTARLGNRVLPIDAPWLSSDEECASLAADYLKISALESYELNFSSIYYPWLEGGSIIEILDPDAYVFEPTRFLMDTIDYGLGLGPMSATGKRVTFVGQAD